MRVLEIRLEDVDALRSLPPHTQNRVVLPDPEADVGQHGPLRVCLDSLRRLVAAHPQETHELLERVGADRRHATRDDGNECEGGEEAARRGVEAASCGDRQNQSAEREPSSGCE